MTRGERIRNKREELGLSQPELAALTKKIDPEKKGISQQNISKIERNLPGYTGSIPLLARALKTTVEELESGNAIANMVHEKGPAYNTEKDLMDEILDAIAEYLEETGDRWPMKKILTEADEMYENYRIRKNIPSRSNIIRLIRLNESQKDKEV